MKKRWMSHDLTMKKRVSTERNRVLTIKRWVWDIQNKVWPSLNYPNWGFHMLKVSNMLTQCMILRHKSKRWPKRWLRHPGLCHGDVLRLQLVFDTWRRFRIRKVRARDFIGGLLNQERDQWVSDVFGWWLGTWVWFFHWEWSSSQMTKSCFPEG